MMVFIAGALAECYSGLAFETLKHQRPHGSGRATHGGVAWAPAPGADSARQRTSAPRQAVMPAQVGACCVHCLPPVWPIPPPQRQGAPASLRC
ncbi:hypothetical protein HPP92_006840 [Vanilla planifolia]|uniref:Uncharacterized protein n=1 Tax=Vanilla planifolia TaxID=51239 RepID=A0A835RQ57_VANPL|nr:hypothetical protein HPP92_006840 [Vanilla planifolia]